jgi:hypothetical protein
MAKKREPTNLRRSKPSTGSSIDDARVELDVARADYYMAMADEARARADKIREETELLNITVDSPDFQGLSMAMDEVVRRNPSAIGIVEEIRAFAKHFTGGLTPPKARGRR